MKNTGFSIAAAALALLFLQAVPAPRARAADPAQTDAEVTAMLTSGQWYFQGQNWSNLRIFKTDGTFVTLNRNNGENGAWKIIDGSVTLIYKSSQDKILLPLRREGCKGLDSKGRPVVVMQRAGDASIPTPPEEITAAMLAAGKASKQTEAEIKALLSNGQWFFQGQSWSNTRVFLDAGTYRGGGDGLWKIADGTVDLGSGELILPIDPKGTNGIDAHGLPFIAVQQPLPTLVTPPRMADQNTANTSAQTDSMIKDLLAKGQWLFQGESWGNIRVFRPDGTFYTQRRGGEGGTWKIISGMVVLSFKSSENILLLPIDPTGTIGKDSELKPFMATQQPLDLSIPAPKPESPAGIAKNNPRPGNAPAPASPEVQQKAAALVRDYRNSLVFVNGREGAGSGFIASLGGKNFLVTNAHVSAGITDAAFKTLDNHTVQGGSASVAVGRDIVCMALPPGGKPLEVMQGVDANASIGDDVVVLGNAGGEGVINTIIGKIVGLGPDRVEVDAPFVPGNSGSPIIHINSGKVIGVATYLSIKNYDIATNQRTDKPVIRRFGYRLDNVQSWQPVDWRTFYAQAAEMKNIETLTWDLYDFFRDIEENNGHVTTGRHTNPIIKNRIDQWSAEKASQLSASDQSQSDANFLSFLKSACQNDVTAAKPHMTYDYFQRKLAAEQQERDRMAKSFDQIIKALAN